jgi:hypothetical protein
MAAFEEITYECLRSAHGAVMVDVRSIEGQISFGDRFEFGATMAEVLVGKKIRLVFLCRADQVSPNRFLESVAVNRGAWLKVATDQSDALNWLAQRKS